MTEQVLQDLITALRRSGVRISLSESIDAVSAAKLIGYGDRTTLKDSLAATLAKSQPEKEIFNTCFDLFFSLHDFPDGEGTDGLLCGTAIDSPLTQTVLSGDRAGLSMAMHEAGEHVEIRGIRFFTQKSLYIQKVMKHMGIEGLDGDMRRFQREKTLTSQQKAEALRQARAELYERVRDFVERQYRLFAHFATEEMILRYLRDARLSHIERQDFHRIHTLVRKMVKRLNDVHSRRKKRAKRGSLDFKKTLRDNLGYQGLLFEQRWRAERVDRPDILALCDVSRSVQAVARFMLLFLYSLNEAVAKIRSFIFCSNLVEVSHIFQEHPVEEALERLQNGRNLSIQLGRTDYGQAFRDFKEKWLDLVTNKTTVLILGDARSNYGNPETGILKLLHERSKRVMWLNPEPPTFWGTGDSEMKRYLPYCFLVRECSTVNHLDRIVDFLLKTR
jgi:uncharacterized protein with von Willebrand factor type A (vWA) domain